MPKKRPKQNSRENYMAQAMDDLAAFDDFRQDVLPVLRKAIKEGWTPEQIEKHPKVAALMAARKITIALTDPDAARALTAIADTQNRREGKAVERREIRAQIESLPDDQLDAHLAALMGDESADEPQH